MDAAEEKYLMIINAMFIDSLSQFKKFTLLFY